MKIFIGFLVFSCFVILVMLGLQAVVAGFGVMATVLLGPARLKSLPRRIREAGALHLLAILVVSFVAMGLSAAATFATKPQVAMLASIAAWLAVAVMPLIAIFHFMCLSPKPKQTHNCSQGKQGEFFPKQLPKAS
jgi:hypothetical protein